MCEEILYQIKLKILFNSHPGVYQLDCSCNSRYIGKSKKNYWHVALNISKTAQKVTLSHVAPLKIPQRTMESSTGFTR